MSPVLHALLWFAGIVALIPVTLWLLRRSPMGAAAAAGGHLRSVASLALSPQTRLVTVEVGSGEARQWLVLGVTPHSINHLHTMPPQADPPAAPAPAPAGAGFAQVLKRMRQGADHDPSR